MNNWKNCSKRPCNKECFKLKYAHIYIIYSLQTKQVTNFLLQAMKTVFECAEMQDLEIQKFWILKIFIQVSLEGQ